MKTEKLLVLILAVIIAGSCARNKDRSFRLPGLKKQEAIPVSIPVDKGFSEYIESYTAGVIPANSPIEIRLTPLFASKADRSATGLFSFQPNIKGKTEWKDSLTIVFTPSRTLDAGKIYTGNFNLGKLGEVQERLKMFPLRIQTLEKDFRVTAGPLECESSDGNSYVLKGELTTSDYIKPSEAENYLSARLGRKKINIEWDHTGDLVHNFTIRGIERGNREQELTLSWSGPSAGAKQKGSSVLTIPPTGTFNVIDVRSTPGENQRIDVVFSDPVDASIDLTGLIYLVPQTPVTFNTKSNIVSILPATRLEGKVTINIESSVRNNKGSPLSSRIKKELDFSSMAPAIEAVGNGVIVPASKNLVFPFRAVNLKAVDLRIVRIFENNLPYFLQENNINGDNSIKRFGRPVYSGRVDLTSGSGLSSSGWNLYTIDLADYIDIEPGVLYQVSLGMRKSYSLFPCSEADDDKAYEEALQQAEENSRRLWEDPDNYYEDTDWEIYYSFGFNWRDRNNPCKGAYYSPDRKLVRNILASNFGLIAKEGDDNLLHVMVNDLLSALPVKEVKIDVYDYQMQPIISGTTDQDGEAVLNCARNPFLVIATKDKDRNYLKVNNGSSLSMSSFDVEGNKPEKGIKAFIYGERGVWRPGDTIHLSLFIKDMLNKLPKGHPVQFELLNPMDQRVDNQVRKTGESNLLVFTTKTAYDAVTGNYRGVFKIGGASFTKRIRIETVKPNRLKIKLTFPDEILGGTGLAEKGNISVSWMNGAVAKNLKSSVDYILKHTKTEFKKYPQYNFDDPAREFYSETVRAFDGTLDANGDASFKFDPSGNLNAPGMLNAVFTVKAAEPGGDESIVQTSFKYAPYPAFAGINLPGLKGKSRMLFTDADNEVKIATVDKNGDPVNSAVEINIYKISYRWWWESDQENLAYYISNNTYKPVITKTITTRGGKGTFTFNINKKDWGRYLIRATLPSGHSTGKILLVDWPWEYGMKGSTDGATLLTISTDKEKYNPGDEVSLSFPSPENARAIVTLENATGIVDEIRVPTGKGNTVVKFRAKTGMAPNIYAYVSVIQPHAQTVNDMPMRLYGVVPVMIEDPATRLSPVIEMPGEIRSQKPFSVNISEAGKKSMTYTLAVVDEGLLDITGFRTPDPWDYFFAREALGVKTWDLYNYVLGAFGGTLERIF
ncbi:MAG TPA: MG2 domain-containing protein, partial [Bacteroidales bacterium]|nr:MG2 domain-containing protein [Bacteroidales bacterium]